MNAIFDKLVDQGVYTVDHIHSDSFRHLFRFGLLQAIGMLTTKNRPIEAIEIGCGAGAWIAESMALFSDLKLDYTIQGSDISERMVGLCRERFSHDVPAESFFVGDLLKDSGFGGEGRKYDIIVAYDVIQQLPRSRQGEALDVVHSRLSPGGVAVIFDNDAQSAYGRSMALKKFAAKYLFLPLVPRFYCYARYPKLDKLAAWLCSVRRAETTLIARNALHKRILLIAKKYSD